MRALKKISFLFSLIAEFGINNGVWLFYMMIIPGKNKVKINFIDKSAPVLIRRGTSDIPTFKQIFLDLSYESVFDNDINYIVDCGANIGLSVRYFRSKFPSAKIIAIEPDTENFIILKENTNFDNRIMIHQKGVWHKKAHLEVVDLLNLGSWGYSVIEVPEKTDKSIDAISIKNVMDENGFPQIDLLKIDIEGSEKEVFESDTESWLPLVNNMIIETHDKYRKGTAKAVLKTMLNYDFELEVKSDSLIFKNISKK
jgi:FkbM family methyltransferase